MNEPFGKRVPQTPPPPGHPVKEGSKMSRWVVVGGLALAAGTGALGYSYQNRQDCLARQNALPESQRNPRACDGGSGGYHSAGRVNYFSWSSPSSSSGMATATSPVQRGGFGLTGAFHMDASGGG